MVVALDGAVDAVVLARFELGVAWRARTLSSVEERAAQAETAALARWWLSEQAADGGKMRVIVGRDFT